MICWRRATCKPQVDSAENADALLGAMNALQIQMDYRALG